MTHFRLFSTLFICFYFLIAVNACTHLPTKPDATARTLATELPKGVYPLAGITANTQTNDLQVLDSILKGVEVIALGETLHMSGGFHKIRSRVIKYLIENSGLRAVTLETAWRRALPATEYVASCKGSVEDALNSLYDVWASNTQKELFEWLCNYNQKHPNDPVIFYGFDAQEPAEDGRALRGFIQKHDPIALSWVSDELKACYGAQYDSREEFHKATGKTKGNDPDTHKKCLLTLVKIQNYLAAKEKKSSPKSFKEDLQDAQMAVDGIRSWEVETFYFESDIQRGNEARDKEMAQIFERLRARKFPGKKSVIIAANPHISQSIQTTTVQGKPYNPKGMGAWLYEKHKNKYAAVGLFAHKVELLSRDGDQPTLPTAENSLELKLYKLGIPHLIVDTKSSFLPLDQYYLVGPGWTIRPSEQYRALIYLEHSEPMKLWSAK